LSTFGYSYFKGNFADRGRYESLVCPFSVFFQMIISKLEKLNFTETMENLKANKDKCIEYLIKNSWTQADKTHKWSTDHWGTTCYYGPRTDYGIRNTKGIRISPMGAVVIAYWDEWGDVTTPRIRCTADKFTIRE
jgi:hypothetical protein